MTINQVTIFQLDWGQLAPIWHPVVVKLTTTTGQAGWGEAGIAYGTGAAGVVDTIKELAPRVIGQDPWNTNAIWQDCYEHTFWAKDPGTGMYAAISALDIALWDLKARAIHQPTTSYWVAGFTTGCRPTPVTLNMGGDHSPGT